MIDHAAFQAGIAANPADSVPLLIYADYLDEHGSVEGQALRKGRLTAGDGYGYWSGYGSGYGDGDGYGSGSGSGYGSGSGSGYGSGY